MIQTIVIIIIILKIKLPKEISYEYWEVIKTIKMFGSLIPKYNISTYV